MQKQMKEKQNAKKRNNPKNNKLHKMRQEWMQDKRYLGIIEVAIKIRYVS